MRSLDDLRLSVTEAVLQHTTKQGLWTQLRENGGEVKTYPIDVAVEAEQFSRGENQIRHQPPRGACTNVHRTKQFLSLDQAAPDTETCVQFTSFIVLDVSAKGSIRCDCHNGFRLKLFPAGNTRPSVVPAASIWKDSNSRLDEAVAEAGPLNDLLQEQHVPHSMW